MELSPDPVVPISSAKLYRRSTTDAFPCKRCKPPTILEWLPSVSRHVLLWVGFCPFWGVRCCMKEASTTVNGLDTWCSSFQLWPNLMTCVWSIYDCVRAWPEVCKLYISIRFYMFNVVYERYLKSVFTKAQSTSPSYWIDVYSTLPQWWLKWKIKANMED